MGEILPWHRFLPHREREANRGAIPVDLVFDLVLEVLVLTCAAQLPHLHDVAILSRVEDMMHHDKVMPLRLGLVPKTSRHVSTMQETRGYAYTSPCL